MWTRCRTGMLAAALVGSVVLPSAALAAGATAEQIIAVAQQLGMACSTVDPSLVQCTTDPDSADRWIASIHPASGVVTGLETQASQDIAGLDPRAATMMDEIHTPACDDAAGVERLVAEVGALLESGTVGPRTVGGCTMQGELNAGLRSYVYTVSSVVIPSATPTPTPAATPTPTPVPTPRVTSSPSASPSPSGAGGATPPSEDGTPTPSPALTTGPGAAPAPSATGVASSSAPLATGEVTPSPEQVVEALRSTPMPSPHGAAPVPGLGFASSVVAPSGIRLDAPALGMSALLALLLLALMSFPGELFNSTVESNYDEIAGWLAVGPGGWARRWLGWIWRGPMGIAVLLGVGALIYALLDPGFGLDSPSLAAYLGLLIGLAAVLVAFELPPVVMHRRRTGEIGSLRALPWTLVAGAVCVLISRLAGFEPGYLYGVLLGVVFRRPPDPAEEGREAAAGMLWTLLAALVAWAALGWLRGTVPEGGFARIVAETALAAVVVAGLEAVAFGMLPFRFLAGAAVRQWSRVAWAALLGFGLFAFVHVLVGPQSGYLVDLAPAGLLAALAVFVGSAGIAVLVWGYFRFRPPRLER